VVAFKREEGQLEHLGLGEAAGLVGRQGPHEVGHAVPRLVEELRRRAAQLHGRVDLALQLVVGFLGDLVAPGQDQVGVGELLGGRKWCTFRVISWARAAPVDSDRSAADAAAAAAVFIFSLRIVIASGFHRAGRGAPP
jgi:hypothetical protein